MRHPVASSTSISLAKKLWDKIEERVVPLEMNLYGQPLAGLRWEREFEKSLDRPNNWRKLQDNDDIALRSVYQPEKIQLLQTTLCTEITAGTSSTAHCHCRKDCLPKNVDEIRMAGRKQSGTLAGKVDGTRRARGTNTTSGSSLLGMHAA